MSGKYLLDTNIIIALVANDTAVLQRFADARKTTCVKRVTPFPKMTFGLRRLRFNTI